MADQITAAADPITTSDLPVGARIRLAVRHPASPGNERRWWTVRAHAGARFVIATRQASFQPAGEQEYTVLDLEQGIRGPLNVVGWGYECTTEDEIAKMAAELAAGEWEISHRNNLQTVVLEVRHD